MILTTIDAQVAAVVSLAIRMTDTARAFPGMFDTNVYPALCTAYVSNNGYSGNSEKQAAQGWGAPEGDAELKDEQAGEAIAQTDAKAAEGEATAEEPEEPEEKQITLDAYLAQQAEKRAGLDSLQIRKANEGSKENKKWNTAKELVKDDDEDFITPTAGKTKRERERKVKQVVDIDQRYVEPPQTRGGARGGRGGARGGPRGDRGDFRGGRGGAPRGGRGAPRGGASAPINTKDESAFPTLGK